MRHRRREVDGASCGLRAVAAGAIVLGLNTLLGSLIYRREKVAAYLLWGSAIVMQIFLWLAVLTITT